MDVWGCQGETTLFEKVMLYVVVALLILCVVVGLPLIVLVAVMVGV